uniref:Uncharacterized protein n=1 Tax=Anguilla anguilla TaxID=7936 RepID=A0A0E9U3R9_ANGAN
MTQLKIIIIMIILLDKEKLDLYLKENHLHKILDKYIHVLEIMNKMCYG